METPNGSRHVPRKLVQTISLAALFSGLSLLAIPAAFAQGPPPPRTLELETIEILGASRTSRATVLHWFPLSEGDPVTPEDLLHAVNVLRFADLFSSVDFLTQRGSEHRDEMSGEGFSKNDAGGTLGGISSGQDILASIALKPTSSVAVPGKTIDKTGAETEIVSKGRHDPCVGLRATPIAEAMVALVLMDHYLRHRAQNADVQND